MRQRATRKCTCVLLLLLGGFVNPIYSVFNTLQLTEPNLIQNSERIFVPAYPVTDNQNNILSYVSFLEKGNLLHAVDQEQKEIWSTTVSINKHGSVFGGFDFDKDGWVDLAYIERDPVQSGICGSQEIHKNRIVFIKGKTGDLVYGVSPMADYCFDINGLPDSNDYIVEQYSAYSVLFGKGTKTILITPSYATQSWYYTFNEGTNAFESEYLYYPSTTTYMSAYENAQGYQKDAHIANGLFYSLDGEPRLLFYSYGRFVHYKLEPFNSLQLIRDFVFKNYVEEGIYAYRNYGLVSIDPEFPENVSIVTGTSAWSLFNDMLQNDMVSDPYGGIHRHVMIHSTRYMTYGDKFYSKADSARKQYQYEGRVVYPSNVHIRTGANSPSRLAYNVYQNGRWYFHISQPNTVNDQYALIDLFVWDIQDIDDDGVQEIIASPLRWAGDPDVSGYYFPKWHTDIYQWNETTLTLTLLKSYAGKVPSLSPHFRTALQSTTNAYLYPVQVLEQSGQKKLLMHDGTNESLEAY